jgi:hypothetical protein
MQQPEIGLPRHVNHSPSAVLRTGKFMSARRRGQVWQRLPEINLAGCARLRMDCLSKTLMGLRPIFSCAHALSRCLVFFDSIIWVCGSHNRLKEAVGGRWQSLHSEGCPSTSTSTPSSSSQRGALGSQQLTIYPCVLILETKY